MSIIQRIKNLWKLSAYTLSAEANSRLNPHFLVENLKTKQPPKPATIVEMDKPNMFPHDKAD